MSARISSRLPGPWGSMTTMAPTSVRCTSLRIIDDQGELIAAIPRRSGGEIAG